VRILAPVEEDHVARVRPDDRAILVDRVDVSGCRVVREHELATPGRVVGAEQQPGQRIGVDVTLEPHLGAALDVQHNAVPVVASRHNRLVADHHLGQVEEETSVEAVQPGEVVPEVASVESAA
jgi:hypothetical protein